MRRGTEVEAREGVECEIEGGVGVIRGAAAGQSEVVGVGADRHLRFLCIHLKNILFLCSLLTLHSLYFPASRMQRFR